LATLEQKFGALSAARETLSRTVSDIHTDPIVTVIKSRISAQAGGFSDALQINDSFLDSVGGRATVLAKSDVLRGPVAILGSTPSIAWRTALVAGLTGEKEISDYWFDAHEEMAYGLHSSQMANNRVFRSTVSLLEEDIPFNAIHEASGIALNGYLQDHLTVSGVLFLNVAKSVVLPMILESVMLERLGQVYDAVLQALLVRRLLEHERISTNAEGIGEIKYALDRLGPNLTKEILARTRQREDRFARWLRTRTNDVITRNALSECDERFRIFIMTGNYRHLLIVDDVFPSVARGTRIHTFVVVWGGATLAGEAISNFLISEVGVKVVNYGKGFGTKAEGDLADGAVQVCSACIVHLSPTVAYEVGYIRGAVEPQKIIYLRTEGAYMPKLAAITFCEDNPERGFHRIRHALNPLLR
jgi:hypothetical protein